MIGSPQLRLADEMRACYRFKLDLEKQASDTLSERSLELMADMFSAAGGDGNDPGQRRDRGVVYTDAEMLEAQAWCDRLLAADRAAHASGEVQHGIGRKKVLAILHRVRDAVARLLEGCAAPSGALQSAPVQRLR